MTKTDLLNTLTDIRSHLIANGLLTKTTLDAYDALMKRTARKAMDESFAADRMPKVQGESA